MAFVFLTLLSPSPFSPFVLSWPLIVLSSWAPYRFALPTKQNNIMSRYATLKYVGVKARERTTFARPNNKPKKTVYIWATYLSSLVRLSLCLFIVFSLRYATLAIFPMPAVDETRSTKSGLGKYGAIFLLQPNGKENKEPPERMGNIGPQQTIFYICLAAEWNGSEAGAKREGTRYKRWFVVLGSYISYPLP